MARRLRCDESQRKTIDAYLTAARARGVSYPSIVRDLAAQGLPVSVGYLHKRARLLAGASASPGKGVPPPPAPEAASSGPLDVPIDVLDELRQALKDARTFSRLPAVRANTREYLSALKLVAELASKLARYLPPPPADPNEAPDMVAAAERCRAKLHEALERLVNP